MSFNVPRCLNMQLDINLGKCYCQQQLLIMRLYHPDGRLSPYSAMAYPKSSQQTCLMNFPLYTAALNPSLTRILLMFISTSPLRIDCRKMTKVRFLKRTLDLLAQKLIVSVYFALFIMKYHCCYSPSILV